MCNSLALASNQLEQVYKVNESGGDVLTPLIHVDFTTQVDTCDLLIGSQADIKVQAQDGYMYD